MEFGERLKEILESKGLKQSDLSRLSGIGNDFIHGFFVSKKPPAMGA